MDAIGNRVMNVIALELVTRPARLTCSTEFREDLQLNAGEFASLAAALEDEFCIVVPDDAMDRMVTIGDAIAYVESALQARPVVWRSVLASRPA